MIAITTDIAGLKGATKRQISALRAAGIATVRDLLFCFPNRYEDFTTHLPVAAVVGGAQVTLVAKVVRVRSRKSFGRRMTITEALIGDESGEMTVIWFNQPYLERSLIIGGEYRFAGKAAKTKFGLRLANPIYESLGAAKGLVRPLMPVYPLVGGVSQFAMRKFVALCKDAVDGIEEPLPSAVREANGLIGKAEAVRGAHFPENAGQRDAARRRLAFDEVLALQLSIGRTKRLRQAKRAVRIPFDEEGTKAFVRSLPFALTDDQRKAAWAALKDMAGEVPMHRLLDGDVGSGKTAVAAIAMVNAGRAGFQSALMAPTEILARQHFETFKRFFSGQGLTVALWTNAYHRSATDGEEIDCGNKKEVERLRDAIGAGEVDAIIGTHALVQEKLLFSSLAFAVIDEQHRFGVRTRQLLCTKSGTPGLEPHLLSMTATPIPRSLALTVFGDLDLSILREKPKGRQEIATRVLHPRMKGEAYARIRTEVGAGRQAFVVCPLIDPSDELGIESVTQAFERLQKEELEGVSMAMLHGKMSADEKESVMTDFSEGRASVLVSTSVVEVGVDVPNATVMCIEGAERFGLSQLHQFRGRIGRGEHPSACFLLPTFSSPATDERLSAMTTHADGFALAEKDLEIRGPGDLLGVAQSGHPALRMASLADLGLIAAARDAAAAVLDADPELAKHAELRRFLALEIEDAHME